MADTEPPSQPFSEAVMNAVAGMNIDSEQPARPGQQQQQQQPAAAAAARRPNQLTMNVLRDRIAKVSDATAETVQRNFESFLSEFRDRDTNRNYYIDQVLRFQQEQTTTIYVDFEHVMEYDNILASTIAQQYYRFEPYLRKAVYNLVKRELPDYVRRDNAYAEEDRQREFWVSWYGIPTVRRLRELKVNYLSQLIAISGTVTRTSEVRPELLFGSFRCGDCGTIVSNVEQEFKYTEPTSCLKPTCNNRSSWHLVLEKSKFVDWQKVRIQENANEVPSGCMPRTLEVILRNEMVERAKAGDKVIVIGTPIVVPDVSQLLGGAQKQRSMENNKRRDGFEGVTGLKALGVRDLTYKMSFLGCFIRPLEARNSLTALHDLYDEEDVRLLEAQFTEQEKNEIREMMNDRLLMSKMTDSVAPHIFGHDNIKKGVLLQLLGGVHKVTPEGMHIRGDINVCVVGDPSTAKSQFLKYVSGIMPRAVYTSGKASSAAGLTASVCKDEETGEFTIEAGALMLADNGICCIDEFDKMDICDQVAIHEAMEQQTISIAKAGIHATLNARTSILAAANPVNGRYDKKLSLKANINMSAPIMSRFDLFFVILDECDENTDYNIGRHIVNYHRLLEDGVAPPYSQEQVLRYMKYARLIKPKLSPEAMKLLVRHYVQLRQNDASNNKNFHRITVRQLESMVRLSEALAKLHCHEDVRPAHVREAFHLLKTSIVHIDREDVDMEVEEDEEEMMEEDQPQPQPQGDAMDAENAAAVAPAAEPAEGMGVDVSAAAAAIIAAGEAVPKQQRFAVSFEEYRKVSESIIWKLRQKRDIAEKNEAETEGMRRSEIIDSYLEDMEERLESEADYMEHKKIVKGVLKKLLKEDGILLALRDIGEGAVGPGAGVEGALKEDKDPLIVLHPHYAVPDMDH